MERWAELRREHSVAGKSIKGLARSMGRSRNTIRRAPKSDRPPGYQRAPRPSVLEPLKADCRLPGVRARELLEPLGRTAHFCERG